LENFVERVLPKDEVTLVRDNILINQAESGQLDRNAKLIKIRQLKAKLDEVKRKNLLAQRKESKLLENLCDKKIELIKSQHEVSNKRTLIAVLESKKEQVEKKIEEEKKLGNQISSTMPIIESPDNHQLIFNSCLEQLDEFYKTKLCNDESKEVKKIIEARLKTLSNSSILKNIMEIISMNEKEVEILQNNLKRDDNSHETLSMITQLNSELTLRGIEVLDLKKKIIKMKEECIEKIKNFENKVASCFSEVEFYEIEDDQEITEYFNELIAAVIANYKVKGTNKRAKTILDNLNLKLSDTKINNLALIQKQNQEISDQITAELLKFEEKSAQIHKIHEKINLLRISSRQKIYSIQPSSNKNDYNQTFKISYNLDEVDSQKYQREFQTFLNTPINKFKINPNEIDKNFIVTLPMETIELLKKTNCNLESVNKFIDSVKTLLKIHQDFKSISEFRELETYENEILFDKMRDENEKNRDKIAELSDLIHESNNEIKNQLKIGRNVYEFILKNPLAAFVPPTITLEGKTYAEFEKEIKMYIRALEN
jgi:hypothetical protein